MKIRSLAAAIAVATLTGTSLLATPAASASTVSISGLTCTITFTEQDFDDMQAHFASYDNSVSTRLRAAIPGVDAEITLISAEAVAIALSGDPTRDYSPAAHDAWGLYHEAGRAAGFSSNERIAMMLMAGMPVLASGLVPEFDNLIDEHRTTRNGAQEMSENISFHFGGLEDILETGTYNGTVLSERAKTIIGPAAGVIADLGEGLREPFQACVDGKQGTFRIGADTIVPPGDGNGGGDNGDGGSGGNGDGGDNGSGGNGNGSIPSPGEAVGGSSFSSS